MSNKFTGITSAGSAIPVYDKDAHEALSSKLDITAFSSVSGEFATIDDVVAAVSGKADTSSIPSLDGYATEQWVGEQGYLTEVPAGYATTEDVISATSGLQPSGDYASATDLVNYQTIEGMSAFQPVGDYQPAGSYLSASESANFYPMIGNPSGFLTEHQSLDGLMQTSGLEYDGDKISGYMGSAFKAGDELPSGVMVESAVEYNAVNEISGYNGSAIAQYGAEKQWLQHDDTLVHAANSAQYALGVNLSAVAQLLGVDETVLWSGSMNTTAQTATVSENINSFNKIQIWARRNVNGLGRAGLVQEFYPTVNVDNTYFYPVYTDMASNTLFQNMMYITFTANNFSLLRGWQKNGTTETTGISSYGFNIEKIVGIGRKQS